MKLSLIVAISDDMAIGKDNDLIWHLPRDLKFFKAKTTGHTILMGRNTFLSLPNGALPNRRNLVLSSTLRSVEAGELVSSVEEAIEIAQKSGETELFVIGGGQLYAATIDIADKLYVTHVHTVESEADTYFPEIDPIHWQLVSEEEWPADSNNPYDCTHRVYERPS